MKGIFRPVTQADMPAQVDIASIYPGLSQVNSSETRLHVETSWESDTRL